MAPKFKRIAFVRVYLKIMSGNLHISMSNDKTKKKSRKIKAQLITLSQEITITESKECLRMSRNVLD